MTDQTDGFVIPFQQDVRATESIEEGIVVGFGEEQLPIQWYSVLKIATLFITLRETEFVVVRLGERLCGGKRDEARKETTSPRRHQTEHSIVLRCVVCVVVVQFVGAVHFRMSTNDSKERCNISNSFGETMGRANSTWRVRWRAANILTM
jgi:hypothetical protein